MAYGPVSIGGYMALSPATKEDIGGVKIGAGVNVTDDGTISTSMSLDKAWPIGSIYQSTQSTSPAELFGGTWVQIAQDKVLMGAGGNKALGATATAGLPNIKGTIGYNRTHGDVSSTNAVYSGALYPGAAIRDGALTGNNTAKTRDIAIDASKSSSIYGASNTVQPPALYVNIWERVGYTLNITARAGSHITIYNNDTADIVVDDTVDDSGQYYAEVPDKGTWMVKTEKDGDVLRKQIIFGRYGSKSVDVSAHVFGVVYRVNSGKHSTKLTRLTYENDDLNFVTTNITIDPVAAVGAGAGSSPFDRYMPWSGMEEYNITDSKISAKFGDADFSREIDTVVYIPEFYYWRDANSSADVFYISDKPITGFKKHPGSGRYVGKYNSGNLHATSVNSVTGSAPTTARSRSNFRIFSTDKGSGWYQYDYMTWNAICMLYAVEYADWDSQARIGKGYVSSDLSINSPLASGSTDSMTYHTGRAAGTDGKTGVQYRHIENLWGNIYSWVDGIYSSKGCDYLVFTDPDSYIDSIPDAKDYYYVNRASEKTGFIKYFGVPTSNTEYVGNWPFIPIALSNTDDSYIPDEYYGSSGMDGFLFTGGAIGNDGQSGLYTSGVFPVGEDVTNYFGSRLIFIPDKVTSRSSDVTEARGEVAGGLE